MLQVNYKKEHEDMLYIASFKLKGMPSKILFHC